MTRGTRGSTMAGATPSPPRTSITPAPTRSTMRIGKTPITCSSIPRAASGPTSKARGLRCPSPRSPPISSRSSKTPAPCAPRTARPTWMPPADRTWFSLRARMCGIIAGTEKPGRNPSRSAQRANACTTVTSLSIRRPACECSWRKPLRPVTKLLGGTRRTAD